MWRRLRYSRRGTLAARCCCLWRAEFPPGYRSRRPARSSRRSGQLSSPAASRGPSSRPLRTPAPSTCCWSNPTLSTNKRNEYNKSQNTSCCCELPETFNWICTMHALYVNCKINFTLMYPMMIWMKWEKIIYESVYIRDLCFIFLSLL